MNDWVEIILAVAGTTASVSLAIWQAKKTAKSEIEKLQAIWAHEKETTYDAEFDEMVAAVSLFIKHPASANYNAAVSKVGSYRSKSAGELAAMVDKLDALLDRHSLNYAEIDRALTAAIECKRKGNS